MSDFQGFMLACLFTNAVLAALLIRDDDSWALLPVLGVAWCLYWLVTS